MSESHSRIEQYDETEPFIVLPVDVARYNEDEDEFNKNSPRRLFNFLTGAIISLFVGVFAGLRSREFLESVVYAFLFSGEGILCEAISKLVPTEALRVSIHRFAILFAETAACSVFTYITKRRLGAL